MHYGTSQWRSLTSEVSSAVNDAPLHKMPRAVRICAVEKYLWPRQNRSCHRPPGHHPRLVHPAISQASCSKSGQVMRRRPSCFFRVLARFYVLIFEKGGSLRPSCKSFFALYLQTSRKGVPNVVSDDHGSDPHKNQDGFIGGGGSAGKCGDAGSVGRIQPTAGGSDVGGLRAEGLQTWLATAETDAETIEVEGKTHRYKLGSEKEFLTPGGMIRLTRRVYQPDAGGQCHVPLDAAWGMENQFATVEVRDAALYAVALGTPQEAESLLAKCSLFQPSATAIKRMAKQMGQWLEEHEDQVLTEIRIAEPVPAETRQFSVPAWTESTCCFPNQARRRGGRTNAPTRTPRETPYPRPLTRTRWLAASASTAKFPQEKCRPSVWPAVMRPAWSEDRAPTLKAKFEQELQETESRLSDDVVRIALCDGARGLWTYIDDTPLYDDYEKLVDYHHAAEHLSKAAEAIFGKGSPQAQNWYDKYCAKLKGENGPPSGCCAAWTTISVPPSSPSLAARRSTRSRRSSPAMHTAWIMPTSARMVGPSAAGRSKRLARALSKHASAAAACAGPATAGTTFSAYAPT